MGNKVKNRHIVATYALKPRRGVPTHMKGWMNNENNLQWDETMKMTEGLRERDRMDAHVILDVDEKRIVKNWKADEGESDYDKIYEYFEKNYSHYMNDFIKKSDRSREKSVDTTNA